MHKTHIGPCRPHYLRDRLAVLALAASLAPTVDAGRPLATDDAAVVAPGACQLESWLERGRDERALWLNPGCNPFGATEFALGGARIRPDGERRFSVVRAQVKHLLRPFDDNTPGFAVALGGSRARGTDQRERSLNGIVTVPLAGESTLLHLNAGASRLRDGAERETRATWAAALDQQLRDGTRAAAEVFGATGERARWQLGLKHELVPGHLQLDASVGSAFGRWSSTRVFTIGLVAVTPAFPR